MTFHNAATVPEKVEPASTNREMLEAILRAERGAVSGYMTRAKQADEFGDKALAIQLENMIRDESQHAEETERMLNGWPL